MTIQVIEAKVYEELALLGESLDGRPFAAWSPRFHSSAIHGAIAHIALGDVTAGLPPTYLLLSSYSPLIYLLPACLPTRRPELALCDGH